MGPICRRAGGLVLAFVLSVPAAGFVAPDEPPVAPPLTGARQAALDRISPSSLRGHLSFIASDLLEGRDTPSRGLDIAAEYIAAQFRRAGLEPVGDDGYFQTATWQVAEPDALGFRLELRRGDEILRVDSKQVTLLRARGLDIRSATLFKLDLRTLDNLQAGQVEGKAVIAEIPDPRFAELSKRADAFQARQKILDRLRALKPVLLVEVDRVPDRGYSLGPGRMLDPEGKARFFNPPAPNPPTVTVHEPRAVVFFDALPAGATGATVALHLGDPVPRPVKVRNVIGLLRGSDPQLSATYVLVTAHYDHLGIGTPVNGDRIYNGANDDGSGTVSVIELASALASLGPHDRPKRSLVFATFFGEEHGLLGSRYYGNHPVFPVEKTVADVNLEQVGRTDSTEGPQVATASMTGIDFSDVGKVFIAAGAAEGVKVYRHPRNSDAYFGASDNQALADLGVPAHTLCVAYAYADYHGAADHWDKVDYANMTRIDRVVARALLAIADDPQPPRWNADNPRARRYLDAFENRHAR
jgi:hypothetical protein